MIMSSKNIHTGYQPVNDNQYPNKPSIPPPKKP
jgi:hypothetical protein